MPTTNIFCTSPNWASNLNPNVGFAVQGDNNVANCLRYTSDGKKIKVNWYWCNANSWFFTNYDVAAIPASVTITSLTGWWYSTRQGGGNGSAQMRHRINTSPEVIHVANHTPQNFAWKDVAALQTRIVRAGGAGNDNDTRWEQHYVSVVWSYTTPQSLVAAHKDITTDGGTITGSYDANGEAGTEYRFRYRINGGPYTDPGFTTAPGSGAVTCNDLVVTGAGPSATIDYFLEVKSDAGSFFSSVPFFVTLPVAASEGFITFH
jgi:hypothetical protein